MNLHIPPPVKESLRRFAWIGLTSYAMSSIGLWAASLVPATRMGPVTAYTVEISIILAVTVGALYTMAMALRPARPTSTSTQP